MEWIMLVTLGWSAGSLSMWLYFTTQGLIRTRSEWYRWRKAQGKRVPDDWQED